MTDNNTSVNGYYAGFGKVIEGMDVVDAISKVESIQEKDDSTSNTESDKDTTNNPKITKMTVETFGVNYGTPQRQEAFDVNSYLMKLYGLSI